MCIDLNIFIKSINIFMNANTFPRNKLVYRLDTRPSPCVQGSGFAILDLVSCPAGKNGGGKIRLHTFRQEFERANRNATFFNRCNSEDGKCELQVHSFTILACVWLQLRQLTS